MKIETEAVMAPEGIESFAATEHQMELLNKLRVLEVSKYVEFPQIAVVGDQSCGKSSVLEGISQFAFPRSAELCTRSVTQFIFRTSDEASVLASVIPGPDRHASKGPTIRIGNVLDNEGFLRILNDVSEYMNIPKPGEVLKRGQSAFSEDILCIQIFGPNQPNLSMIDIPGIFREAEDGKTKEEDIDLVRRLMYRHIRDDRTVILAVVPSNVDIATQEILRIAQEVDPKGLRTLGVLTKPDLVDKGGEGSIVRLVKGESHKLKLGWCVCRNRGQAELDLDSVARDENEATFFETQVPWSSLDKTRVGIPALKQRLRELLKSVTRREFPKVKAQIARQLSDRRERLRVMGPDREDAEDQREFLRNVALQFQEIVSAALDAHYERYDILRQRNDTRLATINVAFREYFAKDLEMNGQTIHFNATEKEKEEERNMGRNVGTPKFFSRYPIVPGLNEQDMDDMLGRWPNDISSIPCPDLFEWLREFKIGEKIGGNVMQWIAAEYKSTRGFGLADVSSSTMQTIWKKQIKNWESITGNYVGHVILSIHHFLQEIMEHVCPDDQVRENILSHLSKELQVRYGKAIDHALFLINLEVNGTMVTMNHYLNDNIQKIRNERAGHPAQDMDNVDHSVQDIHDKLKAYYKSTRKTFIDNVVRQVGDYFLLCGPQSPLRIFTSSYVNRLSHSQLDLIAGEDIARKEERKGLMDEIKALQEAQRILDS